MVTMNRNGCFEFIEDISIWAKEFHNGRCHTVDIAGPIKLAESELNAPLSEDDDSLDSSEEHDSIDQERDSLEDFFNRDRITEPIQIV